MGRRKFYTDDRQRVVDARRGSVAVIEGIGGKNGWYLPAGLGGAGIGWIEPGGVACVGSTPSQICPGRRDGRFRRVEARDTDRPLRLRAEMKMPGLAWLELGVEVDSEARRSTANGPSTTAGTGRARVLVVGGPSMGGLWLDGAQHRRRCRATAVDGRPRRRARRRRSQHHRSRPRSPAPNRWRGSCLSQLEPVGGSDGRVLLLPSFVSGSRRLRCWHPGPGAARRALRGGRGAPPESSSCGTTGIVIPPRRSPA